MSAPAKTGVLLANVGSPAEPTPGALRAYLRRFLSDVRIIDTPRWLWRPILEFILLTRPSNVAQAYKEIWMKEGAPLTVYSRQMCDAVAQKLGPDFHVELGLAYTSHDISHAMKKLEAAGCRRILILPLFPQFSTTTTASVYDEACLTALGRSQQDSHIRKKFIPELRLVGAFHSHPDYQKILAAHIRAEIEKLKTPSDFFMVSFHGIPVRYETEGDTYREDCEATMAALARDMGWKEGQYQLCYQSKFGREPWLLPSTQEELPKLYARGVKHPCIIAPGFVTDCLETLEELNSEGRELWTHGGGCAEDFSYIPCLNASPAWTEFLSQLIRENAWT